MAKMRKAERCHRKPLFIVRCLEGLGISRRQVVFAVHNAFAGLAFEFEAGAFGNPAAGLGGGFVFRESGGDGGFGNLAGGKFGERGEDEFGFAHVVAQVLGFKPFQFLSRPWRARV